MTCVMSFFDPRTSSFFLPGMSVPAVKLTSVLTRLELISRGVKRLKNLLEIMSIKYFSFFVHKIIEQLWKKNIKNLIKLQTLYFYMLPIFLKKVGIYKRVRLRNKHALKSINYSKKYSCGFSPQFFDISNIV